MNLIDKIKQKTEKQKYINQINKRIKNAKYIHLMFNDKFIKPFVELINKNFNPQEHLFLCKKIYDEFPFPIGENVVELKYLARLNFNNAEKLICHSLFDREVVDYFYKHQSILKEKAYWIIYGGDLYDAPIDEKNDFVRSNFKGYLNKIDENYARSKYKISEKQKFYDIFYIFPITKQMLDNSKHAIRNYTKIQINNSCDKSTLEMLDILSKFKNNNIKITTVLSYGEMEYKEKIITKGQELFGNKFEYLDKFISPEKYVEKIAQNDILIFNQNRQQGIGNIIAALYLGSKIYIKKDISANDYFNKNNIKIYNTEDIINTDFKNFIKNELKEISKKNSEKYFDEKFLVSQMTEIF